jgi:hypothetical protein
MSKDIYITINNILKCYFLRPISSSEALVYVEQLAYFVGLYVKIVRDLCKTGNFTVEWIFIFLLP